MIKAHPSTLEGVEAARCDALKCGGTYADFVPLIPRDAGENQYEDRMRDGKRRRTERWFETCSTVYNSI
jgi:hypothetical protein